MGVTLAKEGAYVAVYSQHATKITVCTFANGAETRHDLNKRDGYVHFEFIKDIKAGTKYGLRAEGPWDPDLGLRFDASKLLVDPFAWSLDRAFEYHNDMSVRGKDTSGLVPLAIAGPELPDVKRQAYRKPEFIYELGVKSFTKLHPSVPEQKRGTLTALAEKPILDHLTKLAVDTIELMPITAWIDERHLHAAGLKNAWGYNPVQFFAPDFRLAPGGLEEVRDTVATLHKNNFRVILDVVLNHSGESDQFGPTICFRGLDNSTYYAHARGGLINDTGCGNTLNLTHPHVIQMTIAALRHWVLKTGIDGFRFDLASVMGRMNDGFQTTAPLLQAIQNDNVLSTCILIAEPWDIGPGGYQLGNFAKSWPEWNDKYRDDVRRFWRGDAYSANSLATRITGSSDVFARKEKPSASVNFIAAHDGFTLQDIVTCSVKNNYNNGEDNRDGKNGETTWQGGNIRALLATLFLSRGTLMLTAGDEFGRTQSGNNNAYAQDNDVTWLDWEKSEQSLIDLVAKLMALRRSLPIIINDEFLTGAGDATWFNETGEALNWGNVGQRFVGLALSNKNMRVAIAFNGSNQDATLKLPATPGTKWKLLFNSENRGECPARSVSVYQEVRK